VGRTPVFGAGGQELFWKTNPKKRPFFFIQLQVWGLFSEVSEVYEEYEAPKESEAPKEPVKIVPQSTL
jgi:hypothetical protein